MERTHTHTEFFFYVFEKWSEMEKYDFSSLCACVLWPKSFFARFLFENQIEFWTHARTGNEKLGIKHWMKYKVRLFPVYNKRSYYKVQNCQNRCNKFQCTPTVQDQCVYVYVCVSLSEILIIAHIIFLMKKIKIFLSIIFLASTVTLTFFSDDEMWLSTYFPLPLHIRSMTTIIHSVIVMIKMNEIRH